MPHRAPRIPRLARRSAQAPYISSRAHRAVARPPPPSQPSTSPPGRWRTLCGQQSPTPPPPTHPGTFLGHYFRQIWFMPGDTTSCHDKRYGRRADVMPTRVYDDLNTLAWHRRAGVLSTLGADMDYTPPHHLSRTIVPIARHSLKRSHPSHRLQRHRALLPPATGRDPYVVIRDIITLNTLIAHGIVKHILSPPGGYAPRFC